MTKKVLLIGAKGTVGSAVLEALKERGHDLVIADYSSEELPVDLTDHASIMRVYARAGKVDAVVSTVGDLEMADLADLTLEQVEASQSNKLLGQVDLVLQGLSHVRSGGSFTVISGIMSEIPWRGGITAALANGGLDAFVRAVAAELTGDRRINSVSPSILVESIDKLGGVNPLPGHHPVPASLVAEAFIRSVEGIETGQTFRVGY